MNANLNTQTLLATLAITVVAGTSAADIMSSSPSVTVANGTFMTPDLTLGSFESDSAVRLYRERIGYELQSLLKFDVTATGTGGLADLSPGDAGPGQEIRSYFLHFDPESGSAVSIAGGFQLSSDEEIIGLIFSDDRMALADTVIGRPGVTYPTGFAGRGYDANDDSWTISANRHVFQFTMRAGGQGLDQVRVITQVVPAPGALALTGMGGLVIARRRRTA
ncbi:MAG: hypothetical protein JJ916_14975 [Phycisphaerales bacterium]|nr:hypothetical protein [Phycisphaerales bacterium]